jgi:pyruvate/2-oxoglutarate/acetoin dehydrogenase E1 component
MSRQTPRSRKRKGLSLEVVDLRSLLPYDEGTAAARKLARY